MDDWEETVRQSLDVAGDRVVDGPDPRAEHPAGI